MAVINVKLIQQTMAAQEISYTALAEASGLSRPAISTIIKRGTCSPVNAGKIARALNIEPAELIS